MSELLIGLINPLNYDQVLDFFKRCRYPVKISPGEKVVVVKDGDKIIGGAKLMHRSDNSWILRAICIHPDWRGRGIGRQLVENIHTVVGTDLCYCFVYNHLIDFYESSGFTYTDNGSVPKDLRRAYEHYCEQERNLILMVRYPNPRRMSG